MRDGILEVRLETRDVEGGDENGASRDRASGETDESRRDALRISAQAHKLVTPGDVSPNYRIVRLRRRR